MTWTKHQVDENPKVSFQVVGSQYPYLALWLNGLSFRKMSGDVREALNQLIMEGRLPVNGDVARMEMPDYLREAFDALKTAGLVTEPPVAAKPSLPPATAFKAAATTSAPRAPAPAPVKRNPVPPLPSSRPPKITHAPAAPAEPEVTAPTPPSSPPGADVSSSVGGPQAGSAVGISDDTKQAYKSLNEQF